jgi:hypothetical protein
VAFPYEGWKIQAMDSGAVSDIINLKGYDGAMITIGIKQGNASSGAITVDKCDDVAGTTATTGITINHWWALVDTPQTTTTYATKGTAATSITPSTTGTGSSIYVIDIRVDELDRTKQCIRVNMASSSASNLSFCTIQPYRGRSMNVLAPPFDARD